MNPSPRAAHLVESVATARSPLAKWLTRLAVTALLGVIGWFYVWTAQPYYHGGVISRDSRDYYNLLGRGFLKGHLYLDTEVDPTLAQMKDPWDPVARAGRGLHDATYYKNRYYLYFGVTPELILFVPFRCITGSFISESCASIIFSFAGFLFSIWLVAEVRKHYFARTSGLIWFGLVAALGLATMVPSLLRRPSVWEVPITCAYACAMFSLVCLTKTFLSPRRMRWLALASLGLGLTVGARPVYIFACAGLLVPLMYWLPEYGGWRGAWSKRQWWRLVLAAVVPVALCGIGLAAYNYLRFGSPVEFGQRYQMAGDEVSKLKLFSWSYPWYGFRIYMLAPAGTSPYFAYFTVISPPNPPAGHLGMEDPYGVLPNIPFVFLGLGLIGLALNKNASLAWRPLRAVCTSVIMVGGLTALFVLSFGGITNRYEVDFVPAMVVLAALGTLYVCTRSWFRGYVRILAGAGIAGLILYSIVFNILISIEHNEQLRAEQPDLYNRVAHLGNYPSYWWDQLTGVQYGPLELKVIFPKGRVGQVEAIAVTGTSFRADYLWINYVTEDSVKFGFEHTSRGSAVGTPVHYKPGEIQTIRIDMGSLYPPPAHPFFDHLPPGQAHIVQRTLHVSVNGETSLEGLKEFYDATSRTPSIGTAGKRPAFNLPFTGQIISTRRLKGMMPQPPPELYGPVRMFLKFPPFNGARSEPLVSSGRTGVGDLVFVRYLNDHQVFFGHDNWGGGGRMGEPINIDYNANHTIEIDYGALYPDAGASGWTGPANRDRVIVRLDGKVVLDTPAPFHPSLPDDLVVGNNAIQASSAYPTFTGSLVKFDRLSSSLSVAH